MKTKIKNIKILKWALVFLVLFLVINYFIYGVSRASDNNTPEPDEFTNHVAYWLENKFDKSIYLCKDAYPTKSDKVTSKLKVRDNVNEYQISNIYLTVSGNKITVHYDSKYDYVGNELEFWKRDLDKAKYQYTFCMGLYDDSGNNSWSGNLTTESRRDRAGGSGDHETFDFNGSDWFDNSVPSIVNEKLKATGLDTNKTIQQHINNGNIKIWLYKVKMYTS